MGELVRTISGLFTLWMWIAAVLLLAVLFLPVPAWLWFLAPVVAVLLLVRPRRDGREPVEVDSPLRGEWTVVHSPADKVPSHGVRAYAQSHAIDLIRPRPAGAPPTYPLLGGFRDPAEFASFGEPILAVAPGRVVDVLDGRRDHLSRSSWLAFAYMMVIDGFRDLGGPPAVIGNRVVIRHADDLYSLCAHVQRGSATVAVGDEVAAGDVLGLVGNSGNTSEPHLHFQLMDRPEPLRAAGVPFRFRGIDQPAGAFDRGWTSKEPRSDIEPGVPANYQIFSA